MFRKSLSILALVLTAIFFMVSCGGDTQSDSNTDTVAQTPPAETADVVSDFIFTAYDVEGNPRNTSEWVGKRPVVLNFWGTWCPPCRKEIPDLVKVYDEFQSQGIEIIGLAVNDLPDNVIQFSQQNGMRWVMLMADKNMAMRYQITGVPTTIFINKDGKELGRFVGPRDYDTFKEAFLLTLQS